MREGLLGASYLYTMTDRLPFPTAEQVVTFCHENRGMALHSLRLKAEKDPLAPCLIDQVQVRREMSERFGPLIKCPGYLFPSKSRLSQASSCATAIWKAAELCKTLPKAPRIWDATGGSGVDTWAFEMAGARTVVTEPDPYLADLHRHNASILGTDRIVMTAASEGIIPPVPVDAIYVDPSRMDASGNRVYHPADCQPNPLQEMSHWLSQAPWVWLKLSPMVDPDEALRWFPTTHTLFTVSVQREVKEVLLAIGRAPAQRPERWAIDLDPQGGVHYGVALDANATAPPLSAPRAYLYDADAAVVAGRGLPTAAARYGLAQLHPQSRLLTSDALHLDFPGRVFAVDAIHPPYQGTWPKGASVVVRGYPDTADRIRKRLRLPENAEHYLLATVWGDKELGFIAARRLWA